MLKLSKEEKKKVHTELKALQALYSESRIGTWDNVRKRIKELKGLYYGNTELQNKK